MDTLGMLVGVHVHPANVHDLPGGLATLRTLEAPPPAVLFADSAYQGAPIAGWLAERGGRLDIVALPRRVALASPGDPVPTVPRFAVLPKRWVVERTFAWLGRNRRLSKDYEVKPKTTEAWIYLAMSALMARRLA